MPPGIGFSFQPGSQDTPLQPRNGQGGQGTAPQQAIRTLSLRVPQTQSVPGIAPLPLLNAQGGGGSDLSMLLMALMKAFGGGGGGMGVPGMSTPPRIRPVDPNDPMGRTGPEPAPGPRPSIPRDFPPRNPDARPVPIPSPLPPRDFPPTDGVPEPLPPPTIPPRDFPQPGGPLEELPGFAAGTGNGGGFQGRRAVPRMVQPLF